MNKETPHAFTNVPERSRPSTPNGDEQRKPQTPSVPANWKWEDPYDYLYGGYCIKEEPPRGSGGTH